MTCMDNNAVAYVHYRLYRLDVVIYFCIFFSFMYYFHIL